jgi:hypothetical protein
MIAMYLVEGLKDLRSNQVFIYNLDLSHLYIDREEHTPIFVMGNTFFDRSPLDKKVLANLTYMSPEELQGKGRQLTTPYWVLGILMF